NVASCLTGQGKYVQAQPLYDKALAIRRRVLGEEHPDTAASYNDLARNLQAQGNLAEAESDFQRALQIRRKVLGEQHPLTHATSNFLALELWQQGKHREAARMLESSLPGQEAARLQRASSGFERALGRDRSFSPRLALAAALA